MSVSMWEILVPTEKRVVPADLPADSKARYYTTRYHQVWDEKVRKVTGGLTILQPVKGQWVSPNNELFKERMIPVRLMATEEQISQIIDLTMQYYDQLAVMCYRVSDTVILRYRRQMVKEHPCKNGCMYAKDVGMGEYACALGCMYDKQLEK